MEKLVENDEDETNTDSDSYRNKSNRRLLGYFPLHLHMFRPGFMKMTYISIILSFVIVLLTYWVYRLVNWIWLKPKRLEKCLREQGFSGNPYRLLKGDQEESSMLIAEAISKPIKLSDDIKERVIPHVLHTIKNHGVKSFMWEGRIPRVHITEPELIKEILVKHNTFRKNVHDHDPAAKLIQNGIAILDGDKWSGRRQILNTSFRFEKLKLMLPQFYSSCLDMVTKWENQISKNGGSVEVDAHRDLEALSGDIIARTLFGSNFQECERIFALIKELLVLVIQTMQSVYIPGRRFLPTRRNNKMKQINKEARDLVMGIVNKKMKALESGEVSKDFLGILLEYHTNQSKHDKNKSNNISIEEIIEECKFFYFAGQETTANLLSWTLVLLSANPEWQKRAREEVLEVFGDAEPSYDGINRLKSVNLILYEVLRLYPPVVELSKIVSEDIKIGDVFLPAGAQVMLPTIILHHDPEIWGADVKEFKPERFSEGVSKAAKKQGTYFPFGMGPRICIGQNYSLLEAKLALSLILKRFWFELSPSYQHAPYTLLAMQPQFGIPINLHKL